MKKDWITCDVIQDLLPLYEDGCCSEQSKKIVEDHLVECRECRGKSSLYQEALPETEKLENTEIRGIKKGLRKINRWKRGGIIFLCLAVVLVFVILPGWNYANGSGLTYVNIKAAWTAFTFERALVSGGYEKAYRCLDIDAHFKDLVSSDREALLTSSGEDDGNAIWEGIQKIEENGLEWYREVCREAFMENMMVLEEENETICSYSDFQIAKQPWGWSAGFAVRTSSGQEFVMELDIYPDGIRAVHVSPAPASVAWDQTTGEMTLDGELESRLKKLSRLYISPNINKTVMEMLYGSTDYDWERLFAY